MVEKASFNQLFAERLRIALLEAGHYSQRSTSGVDIHKLAEITSYSPQICRKYLRGQAIPEPAKLIEIANKLNVSPGWLLFGDPKQDRKTDALVIDRNVLYFILTKGLSITTPKSSPHELANFLMRVCQELSELDVTLEQAKAVINLALSSTTSVAQLTSESN